MKANFILAAGFVLAGAAAASASTVNYTFADDNGVPYCDGVSLDMNGNVAAGIHTNGAQCTEGDYAGGLQVKLSGSKGKNWIVTTTDANNLPGMVETYFLDLKTMTWQVYDQNTHDAFPFQLVNSGVLLNGTPPARSKHHSVSGKP